MIFRESLICFIIVLVAFAFVLRTLNGPGITWDEANFIPSSISYLNWFQTLKDDIKGGNVRHAFSKDTITNYWRATTEHPPFAKLLAASTIFIFHKFTDLIFAARISTAFIFSILILLIYKFTRLEFQTGYDIRSGPDSRPYKKQGEIPNGCRDKTYRRYAGYFSAISLLIMPRIFGHAHFASLDICMSFMWFLTVFSFVKGIKSLKWSIITGIVYGLALATKLNALFLPIPILIWAHLYHRKEYSRNVIAMLLLSPLVFISIWPWLWPEPIPRIVYYFASKVERISIPTYYLGTAYKEITAPWHYPIVMTFATLPPVVLVLTILGIARIAKAKFADSIGTLILLNIITCIGIMVLPRAQKYDGVRLFLPAFPFIASLAGMTLARILQGRVGKPASRSGDLSHRKMWETSPDVDMGRGRVWAKAKAYAGRGFSLELAKRCLYFQRERSMIFLAFLLLASGALPLINIHPYYLSYYNVFVGGVKGGNKLGFETTYWGDTCTDEVLNYLNENAKQDAKAAFYPAGCNVVPLYRLTGRLRKDIKPAPLEEWETLDYLVLNCRQGFFDERLWQIYKREKYEYATTFQDVPLTAVYKIPLPPLLKGE